MKTPFLCSVIIILLCSCSKIAEPNYWKLDPQICRATTFKEGSYFVYKDSASSMLDSFWVFKFSNDIGEAGEHASCQLKDTQRTEFWVRADRIISPDPILFGQFHHCFTQLISFEENTQMGRPYYLAHHPTLLVNGNTYLNVYETFNFKMSSVSSNDTLFSFHAFYSPESGLVKFSYHHKADTLIITHGTWELERSKLIR